LNSGPFEDYKALVKLLLVVAVAALAGCTKVEDPQGPGASTAQKVVEPRSAPSGIEKLVADLESCDLEGYQITSTCLAMERLTTELAEPNGAHELSLALGAKLLGHRAPAVRLEAATMLGTDRASRDAIVDAARKEPDAHVREAMIRIIAAEGAKYPRVGAFLLESTQFPVADVRAQALAALTLPASRALPGAADRVLAMAERDPDPALRRAACAAGGKLGNPIFLPFYETATARTDDPELSAACMEGVVAMFHNQPAFDTANEDAYHLFLKRLAAQPRTEHSPPWQVMSAFCYYSHEADLDKLAAWKRQATWFKPAEVKAVMTAVITDRATSWQARAAAIESMVGLGATKDELKALGSGYDKMDKADQLVLAKLDSALAE
jgi:hypothetical protein